MSFDEAQDEDKTQIHRVRPLESSAPDARSAGLICIAGRSVGQMYLLTDEETSIGRAPECGISIDDEGVSREHAKVIQSGEDFVLVDLGSTNGTFFGGEPVDVLTLKDGQKFQVGASTILQFRFQDQKELQFHTLMQTFKTHDPMTETYNKRAFAMELEKEVGFARRHEQPLALIMFDLDHFKRVNDNYGHLAGDMVIRSVAEHVQTIIRKEDILARYGGEEFALLLRKTEIEPAFILAERIRRMVESLELLHEGRRIPVTVSLGVARLDALDDTPERLLEAADKRMYDAKEKGRNRVECVLFDS